MPDQLTLRLAARRLYGCDCASCRGSVTSIQLDQFQADLDDGMYDDDDSDYDDDDGPRISEDDDDDTRDLWWHGYKPRPVFHGDGPVFLGMELEVEAPSNYTSLESYARKVRNGLGEVVYLQEDSSIGYGFEVTTHPMSYSWAMENFEWDYLPEMSRMGFRTHRDVGIHVHVSRDGFASECHLYRWMKFIYRNENQVQRLARRSRSNWASFAPDFRAHVKRYIKKEDYLRGWLDDRYQAINPNNRNTLEVRVFASSLVPGEVKAALAFVAGTVEYTRALDAHKIIRESGWAWSSFVKWLRHHGEYRPLLDELEALSCVS